MDSEVFSFDEIYPYIQGCVVKDNKRGYFGGMEDQILYLVEAYEPARQPGQSDQGKWIVKYNGEISYVSPKLYDFMYKFTSKEILGQTLPDGTALTQAMVYDRVSGDNSKKRRCSVPVTDTQNQTKKIKITENTLPDLSFPIALVPKTRKKAGAVDPYTGLDVENRKILRALRRTGKGKKQLELPPEQTQKDAVF